MFAAFTAPPPPRGEGDAELGSIPITNGRSNIYGGVRGISTSVRWLAWSVCLCTSIEDISSTVSSVPQPLLLIWRQRGLALQLVPLRSGGGGDMKERRHLMSCKRSKYCIAEKNRRRGTPKWVKTCVLMRVSVSAGLPDTYQRCLWGIPPPMATLLEIYNLT